VTTLTVGRIGADQNSATNRQMSPGVPDATNSSEPVETGVRLDDELREVLAPMLEAIVRLASANAGTISVIGQDGSRYEPVVTVGLVRGHGGLQSWCTTCAESRNLDSECVRSALCGHDERIPADVLGRVCKHVAAVPLRHKDRPVGALNLMFAAECALPPQMTPLLRATGDLVGMTLDNARLSRENLRIRLTNERQMLANEVHDSLAQGLTYMRMRMNLLRDAIRRNDELRAHKFCSDVDDALGNSQRRLRELITYFRTRMDPQGLAHALRETSDRFLDRTGVELAFDNRIPDLYLPPEREIEVFHIVQEALANITRHAHATGARLLIERIGDDYHVVVEDDGVGLAADSCGAVQDDSGHYGIAIMRERARRLGGNIALGRAGGTGTRLELTFPARSPRSEAAQ
jgi:two-component system nitrate/nitrite sensor histidine kinase NarX